MLSPFITQHQKQSHLLISPLISSETSAGFEAVTLMGMDAEFSNIWFSPWKLSFLLAANTIGCFSWSDRLMLFIFEKMSARSPNVNNHNLFVIHPRRIGVPWKGHLVQLWNSHTNASPSDSHHASICSRRAFGLPLILLYRMLRECVSRVES